MVFSKLAELISSASGRILAKHSSKVPYMLPGLPFEAGSAHRFGLSNPGKKNNLRLSSSLQDFSAYDRLDSEQYDPGVGVNVYSKQLDSSQREKFSSSFSKEKALFGGTQFICRNWVRVFLLLASLLLSAFVAYMVSMYIYSNLYKGGSKFYVVLDGGSTRTRAYVYEASIDHNNGGTFPIFIRSLTEGLSRKPSSQSGRAYDRMETEPGFDKLVHNKSGLKAAIKPLFQWAEKRIPEHAHKTSYLFIYATAGVRRLPAADSKWLLEKSWSIVKGSPFLHRREWIKIISGTEEAYHGWTALNYRAGVLGTIPKKAIFGALDLGGLSLQVTFESENQIHNDTNLNLRIGAVNHHLTAYSLSGCGLNDTFDKSVAELVKRILDIKNAYFGNGKIEVKHPCLQSGYKEQYICSRCVYNQQESGSPLVGEKILGKGGKSGISVLLIGDPNWEECSVLAKAAVNLSKWLNLSPTMDCDLQPCALVDGFPHPSSQFYAISGFLLCIGSII